MTSLRRKYPVAFASFLQVVSTLLFSIWVNFVTTAPSWLAAYHLILFAAVITWVWQLQIVRGTLSNASRQFVRGMLRLGVFALSRYANVAPELVRGMVHEIDVCKPARGMGRSRCLCKLVSYSHVPPQDTGPIDTELEDHRRWFYNVKAVVLKQIAFGDVDWANVPNTGGRAPAVSHNIKSVVSIPIMAENHNDVVGTLTFDSQETCLDMRWDRPGSETLAPEVEEIIAEIRESVRCLMLNLEPDSA